MCSHSTRHRLPTRTDFVIPFKNRIVETSESEKPSDLTYNNNKTPLRLTLTILEWNSHDPAASEQVGEVSPFHHGHAPPHTKTATGPRVLVPF